ncbi:MAG: hypothetical protein ACUVQ1_08360 [Candidatus Kapaibacteriales bacterium]
MKEIRDKSGDIEFAEVKSNIFTFLDMLGFPLIFDFVESNDVALQMFRNNQLRRNEFE